MPPRMWAAWRTVVSDAAGVIFECDGHEASLRVGEHQRRSSDPKTDTGYARHQKIRQAGEVVLAGRPRAFVMDDVS